MQNLTDDDLVGLPDHELLQRGTAHRGVFSRRGLIVPTDTTVYHLCPASHFNAYLPLNKRMRYYSPDYPSMGFVQVFRDTKTLCQASKSTVEPDTSDTPPVYYVLQIELDLLITDFSDGPDPLAPQIRGGINEMAITRIWIAERDPKTGELSNCGPPVLSERLLNAFQKQRRVVEKSHTAAAAFGNMARENMAREMPQPVRPAAA